MCGPDWFPAGTITTEQPSARAYDWIIAIDRERNMLTLTLETGQSVQLGQAIQHGKKTVYVWAIDGDKFQVSCDAPRDVSMLHKYAEIRSSRRDSGTLLHNDVGPLLSGEGVY
jgi:sRNA-binding carbon storage regulator CsrA